MQIKNLDKEGKEIELEHVVINDEIKRRLELIL